jgi:hypothetical protein
MARPLSDLLKKWQMELHGGIKYHSWQMAALLVEVGLMFAAIELGRPTV